MEKKMRAYEKYIAGKDIKKMDADERQALTKYHNQMVTIFQHERLIHLLVTLFFALLAVVFMMVTGWTIYVLGVMAEMMPLYLITLMLVILTVCYVKHYYFLENHVQGLYKYTDELMK